MGFCLLTEFFNATNVLHFLSFQDGNQNRVSTIVTTSFKEEPDHTANSGANSGSQGESAHSYSPIDGENPASLASSSTKSEKKELADVIALDMEIEHVNEKHARTAAPGKNKKKVKSDAPVGSLGKTGRTSPQVVQDVETEGAEAKGIELPVYTDISRVNGKKPRERKGNVSNATFNDVFNRHFTKVKGPTIVVIFFLR